MIEQRVPARSAALWALFALLLAIYLATGSGRFRIVDEVSLFSVTESVAKRASLDTNAIAWTQWVNSPGEVLGAFGPEGDVFSKKGPAPAFLAVPFYLIGWLSGKLPAAALHLSMLQTAYWLNAVATALTGVLLAKTALALGYRLQAALIAGLIFGLGTIAWPYATHFFGEPVSALVILGVSYALLRLRQTGGLGYALAAGLTAGIMIATSVAHAVLLAPFGVYLILASVTPREGDSASKQISASKGKPFGIRSFVQSVMRFLGNICAFFAPLVAIAALLAVYNEIRFGVPFGTGYHFDAGEGFTANWPEGLWGLLFSPYRGLFWYTPVAILSVAAWPDFIRRHRAEGWLLLSIALALVLLFGKWWMWWGGFAWGPRFLVPLAPILVLVLLPWFDPTARKARRVALIVVAILSGLVQALAVAANYVNYEIALRGVYPTDWADPLKYGPPAMFNPGHSPILGQIRLLLENPAVNLMLGWIWPGRIAWQVPALALGVLVLAGLAWFLGRRQTLVAARVVVAFAVLASLALAVVSAQVYSRRPEYGTPDVGYAAALAEIEAEEAARPSAHGRHGDAIITIAPYDYQIPMARYRGRLPIYGYAAETLPLHPETESVLWRALTRDDRLWLLTVGRPPADPANGIEVWLAQQAFKADDRWLGDARKALFVTATRLDPLEARARFGDSVRLLGARASKLDMRSSDVLAVELTWVVDAPVGDLRGFVQLLASDGRLVAQQDGVPGGGYSPSIDWRPGAPVTDRRGLTLPLDLPAGEYTLIAGLYDAASGQRLAVAGLDGAPQGDFMRLMTVRVE